MTDVIETLRTRVREMLRIPHQRTTVSLFSDEAEELLAIVDALRAAQQAKVPDALDVDGDDIETVRRIRAGHLTDFGPRAIRALDAAVSAMEAVRKASAAIANLKAHVAGYGHDENGNIVPITLAAQSAQKGKP